MTNGPIARSPSQHALRVASSPAVRIFVRSPTDESSTNAPSSVAPSFILLRAASSEPSTSVHAVRSVFASSPSMM